MRLTLHPYAAGLAAVAALLLGACSSGDPTPPPSTSSGASVATTSGGTSPTSSTTSTAPGTSATTTAGGDPDVPAAARANTAAGAEAFTAYFMAQVNRAYQRGDSSLISKLSSTGCKSCRLSITAIDEYERKHQQYKGDFATPTTVTLSSFNRHKAEVFVATSTEPGEVVNQDGSVAETLPADSTSLTVYLAWQKTSWTTVEIKINA